MNIEFANRLIDLRKKYGYSQEKLAEKIGISRQAISKWERAESSPDTDNLIALSRLYQISLDELLNFEESNKQQPTEKIADEKNDNDKRCNVIFKFKRSAIQFSVVLSAEFNIDNQKAIRVAPDTSVEAYLEPGSYTIRASMPLQGNEGYVVTAHVDLKSDTVYEIEYRISSFPLGGIISVNEISTDNSSNKKSAPVVTKGQNSKMTIIVALVAFIFIAFSIISISVINVPKLFKSPFENEAIANVNIAELNVPGVNMGLKITATEIKFVEPKYSVNDQSVVAINFVVENVSEREVRRSHPMAYIDDVEAKPTFGEKDLRSYSLASGKSATGYLYYYVPKDAKKIELKFDAGHDAGLNDIYITFSLDIPSKHVTKETVGSDAFGTESESQTNSENSSTESETEKEIVVTALNTPGVNAGLKMTATDIKIVKPEYDTRSVVAVYFEVENQSKEGIGIILPLAYADGKKADYTRYGNDNFSIGYLESGKRMTGYIHHYIPDNAKKIEMKFNVGLSKGLFDTYITFSLDIPSQ